MNASSVLVLEHSLANPTPNWFVVLMQVAKVLHSGCFRFQGFAALEASHPSVRHLAQPGMFKGITVTVEVS